MLRRVTPPRCLLPCIVIILGLLMPAPTWSAATAAPSAPPNPPVWPVPDLKTDILNLLVGYYNQRATASTPYYYRAPEWEVDKALAKKDPDTLWEYFGGPGTACHAAVASAEFITCAGYRLAKTFGLSYSGGLSLFDAAKGYYANDAYAQMAGYYALYHAFAYENNAPNAGGYTAATARDAKQYHLKMIRAYEAHMRDVLFRMFNDTRTNGQFQMDLTRVAGLIELNYVRVVEAMEEYNAWGSASDRRNALALINALNQRIWWEWVWVQPNGPRTAGFADFGSEATYQAAIAGAPAYLGTNQFVYDGVARPSLRPAALDVGGNDGLWFDADYALPGEWWCFSRFASPSIELLACLAQARRESKNGSKSPFGQYYGIGGNSPNCNSRSGSTTIQNCGVSNLGSIAEEWSWTYVGARAGMFLIKELVASGDPVRPAGAIGPNEYAVVTDRLGYGISGWHGGDPYHDDMEWTWNQNGGVQAIRTLSGARHDFEMQDGRYSLGEADTSTVSTERKGDTWASDAPQEYPGGIENHLPGPNSLYGTLLLRFPLDDKVSAGLSGSLYDQFHRNHVDEFNSWIWLFQSTYSRCTGVTDPADNRCFAFSPAYWPNPATVNRVALYTRPDDGSMNLRFRYLWRDPSNVLQASYVAGVDTTCRGGPGLPWRHAYDLDNGSTAGYFIDEGGYGAYNELIQGLGGILRLLAQRYAVETDGVQKAQVQQIWYNDAYTQMKGILALFRDPAPAGYGYVPEIENSTCAGTDPMVAPSTDPAHKMMLTWQVGTGDSASATAIHRAMLYSTAALWYWWYDSDWLNVDAATW